MGVCLEMKAGSVCYEGGCAREMVSVHAFVCMLLRQCKMIMGGCNSRAIQFSTLTHAQTAHISWQGLHGPCPTQPNILSSVGYLKHC